MEEQLASIDAIRERLAELDAGQSHAHDALRAATNAAILSTGRARTPLDRSRARIATMILAGVPTDAGP